MSISGLQRRELYVDARDLQSDSDPEKPMTLSEYTEVLANRGREKMAETQCVQSFEATVRSYGATYQYGEDFFLGDLITVTDERLGVTVDASVEGVQQSITREGRSLSFTFGYGQPTLHDILRRKTNR